MVNAEELRFTVAQSALNETGEDAYIVTVNDAGQHAIWPAARPRPAGWRVRTAALSLGACRQAVTTLWPDITPSSISPGTDLNRDNDVQNVFYDHENGSTPDRSPESSLVPSRFAAQAARDPGALAVRGTAQLTYGALVRSANQLAHALREIGVGPETVTGVGLERGADSIIALLGILTAGGGYLPMDPALPAPRLAQMCGEAGARVILLNRASQETFAETKARLVFFDELRLDGYPATRPEVPFRPENVAYVISTSGSTGEPKAVAVGHGSLAAVSTELMARYHLSGRDRVLQLAPLSTDTSLEQIFVTLLAGATLVLPPPGPA